MLDAVLQFPDIPGPMVGHHHVDRRGGNPADHLVHLGCKLLGEMVGQKQNVLPSVAQGRQVNGEHVDSVVQVRAEVPVLDRLIQVAIGGHDDPDVGRSGFVRADPLILLLLQNPQELDLNRPGEVPDFVQEERAPLGLFDPPDAGLGRAGKGALLVAEQLAFQQSLAQRCAVDLHKRPAGAGAGIMHGRGDQFLSRPGLTADQHGGIAAGDLVNTGVDLAHGLGVADDALGSELLAQLGAESHVFGLGRLALELFRPSIADVVGDHGRDDAQHAFILCQVGQGLEGQIDGQGAHDLLSQQDGHADEAQVLCVGLGSAMDSSVELGLFGDSGDDGGPCGLEHASGDTLPGAIADVPLGSVYIPGGFDQQFRAVRAEQQKGSSHHSQGAFEHVEDLGENLPLSGALYQDLRDLVERFEFSFVALVVRQPPPALRALVAHDVLYPVGTACNGQSRCVFLFQSHPPWALHPGNCKPCATTPGKQPSSPSALQKRAWVAAFPGIQEEP